MMPPPRRPQAQDQMKDNVEQGRSRLGRLDQVHGLIAEGAEGGKTAQDTNHHKKSRLVSEQIPGQHLPAQRADDKTTHDIDC